MENSSGTHSSNYATELALLEPSLIRESGSLKDDALASGFLSGSQKSMKSKASDHKSSQSVPNTDLDFSSEAIDSEDASNMANKMKTEYNNLEHMAELASLRRKTNFSLDQSYID